MKVKIFSRKNRPPMIIPVFIPHMGCPHRCLFCNQNIVTSSRVIHTEDIKKIVHSYLSWKSIKRKKIELSFYGGSFTALPEKTMKEYIKTGEKIIDGTEVDCLRCSTRPDAISHKKAEYLKNHNFHTVELGVQSFSDRLLSEMKRGHDSNSVIKAFHILKEKGLSVCYQFMTGFPGETLKDIEISIETLKKYTPDFVRIYPFAPLPEA
ncbi:MAG: radical SAM protein, partial [bacterium]